jgi:hypothetical protein
MGAKGIVHHKSAHMLACYDDRVGRSIGTLQETMKKHRTESSADYWIYSQHTEDRIY